MSTRTALNLSALLLGIIASSPRAKAIDSMPVKIDGEYEVVAGSVFLAWPGVNAFTAVPVTTSFIQVFPVEHCDSACAASIPERFPKPGETVQGNLTIRYEKVTSGYLGRGSVNGDEVSYCLVQRVAHIKLVVVDRLGSRWIFSNSGSAPTDETGFCPGDGDL